MENETLDPTAMINSVIEAHGGHLQSFLTPVLILISWTAVMWLWMYATRIPAMQKAKINPDDARHPGTYGDRLPANVRAIADNYNHLHEQPTSVLCSDDVCGADRRRRWSDAETCLRLCRCADSPFTHSGHVAKSDATLPRLCLGFNRSDCDDREGNHSGLPVGANPV